MCALVTGVQTYALPICLLYQIRRCSAPCVGRIGKENYAVLVGDAQDFLEGRSTAVQKRLGDAMTKAADTMDYEQATVLRDRLTALTFIQGSQDRKSLV